MTVNSSFGSYTTTRLTGFEYTYQYKDHLGNIRLSYQDMNGDGVISAETEIKEENHYYPFGLKHKGYDNQITGRDHNYGYNGIEESNELGNNMLEMDMRQYDPAIARWIVIDPVDHHEYSPYQAFDNNPIFWADPSGADAEVSENGNRIDYTGQEAVDVFNLLKNSLSSNDTDNSENDRGGRSLDNLSLTNTNSGISNSISNVMSNNSFASSSSESNNNYSSTLTRTFASLFFSGASREYYRQGTALLRHIHGTNYAAGSLARTNFKALVRSRATPYLGKLILDHFIPNKNVYNPLTKPTPSFWVSNANWNFAGRISGVIGGIGMAYQGYGVYNYYADPTNPHVVHPGRFAADTFFTGVMYYGGPWGFLIGGVYHGGTYLYDNGYRQTPESKAYYLKTNTSISFSRTCFIAGTKITLNDGTNKNIEDIVVGDKILSVNINNMKIEEDEVILIPLTEERYNQILLEFENGINVVSSEHHPFYVKNKGWCVYNIEMAKKDINFRLKQLEEGDIVYYYDNGILRELKLLTLTNKKKKAEMYNLKYVKKNNTFFANGILVHNRYVK